MLFCQKILRSQQQQVGVCVFHFLLHWKAALETRMPISLTKDLFSVRCAVKHLNVQVPWNVMNESIPVKDLASVSCVISFFSNHNTWFTINEVIQVKDVSLAMFAVIDLLSWVTWQNIKKVQRRRIISHHKPVHHNDNSSFAASFGKLLTLIWR